MEIIIQGDKIETRADFHQQVKELLNFPECYGNNLDALWDCLNYDIDLPIKLVWKDFEKTKTALGEYADKALSTFKDAANEIPGFSVLCT